MVRHVSMALLALLLAACGGAPVTQSPTTAPAPTDGPAPTSAPTVVSATTDRSTLIAEGLARARAFMPILTPSELTDNYRLVRQEAFGDAQVPLTPTRIVTLDPSLSDAVIALGYGDAIVGTVVDYNGDVFHEHLADLLPPDVAKLGQEGTPNLERIVALRPDLILTWDWYPDNIGELQQIAPTVVMPFSTYEQQVGNTYSNEQYVTWLVREVAAVLGVEERVAAALQPFRDAVAQARPLLAAALGEQRVGFVDIRNEQILLSGYGSDGISALLYGDLGVRPDPLSETLYVWEELSLEKVPQLSSDQLLAFVDGVEAGERYEKLKADPLWQKVPAVQSGKVFIVPSGLYYRGDDGPLGATRVVGDIVQKLTGQELAAVAPGAGPDPAALVVLEETAEYRLIRHSIGEARVPLQPQRVVTLQDQNALLPLFDLGFRDVVGSVGAVQADGSTYFRRMQSYDTSSVVYVGEYGTPNLEQIAALAPDLIVGSQYDVTTENYELLSAIAPTVAVEQFTRPISAHYADFALLVNRADEAQALKARFDARLAEVKAKLPQASEITVSMFYVESPGKISAEADADVSYHIVFDGLGLAQKPQVLAARANDQFYIVEEAVSFELLPEFDADVIIVPYWGESVTEDVEALQRSPLWQQLNAVQKGQAYIVPGEQWFGMAYQPMFNILDFIEANLANRPVDRAWEPAP